MPEHFRVVDNTSDPYLDSLTYETMIARARIDPDFRDGLLAAAKICRANGRDIHPCPSDMAAGYIERVANGLMP